MKYIVLQVTDITKDGKDFVREIPFVFPDLCVHSMVAENMTRMFRKQESDGRKRKIETVSAGFISSMALGNGKTTCHGNSESLKLKSRPGVDDQLIHMFDYLHGIV